MSAMGRSVALAGLFVVLASPPLRAQVVSDPNVLETVRIPQDVDSMMMPVTFKGTTYGFLFDTGANHTIFDNSLRSLLGESAGVVDVTTATGATKMNVYGAVEASIGRLKIQSGNRVGALDLRGIGEASGYTVRGILGMDVFARHVIRIDIGKGELAFLQAHGDDAGIPIDVKLENGCPYVRAGLAGWRDEGFLIDTGSIGGAGGLREGLYRDLVEAKLLVSTLSGSTVSASGKALMRAGKLKEFSLGVFSHKNLFFSEANHNRIGLSVLSHYVVTFDFPNGKMYLKKGVLYDRPEFEDFSGLSLIWRNEKVIVESVRKGSAGFKRGIQPQDEIATIDGRQADKLRLFGIRHLFCEKGRMVRLTIKRNGKEYEAEMTLQ